MQPHLVWHLSVPRRLAIEQGFPPPDITEREQQLVECIDGTREVTHWGWCVDD